MTRWFYVKLGINLHCKLTQDFSYECVMKLSYFSTKTYVVGTQKNRLIETFLLNTQNIC